MIGFLRFVGLFNAAVWFGAAVFFAFGASPALWSSPEIKELLGPRNYPFYSGAIAQIMFERYFRLELVCGLIAVLHLLAGWLYSGKIPQRLWLGLLVGLISLTLANGLWLEPKVGKLHATRYSASARPETRLASARVFSAWQNITEVVNLVMVGGLAVYLWRIANPPDATRFVSAKKFRS